MAEEMYQWSSATYNVGSADNIPGKMTEWSRGTVADGKWLNRVTIIPFSGRDEYLLESINDIHDKKQPKLTNDNAGYGISIDAESEEIENAIIKLNPINTSNIGYVSGDNNEIGFALSADITANSITAQDLTLVNLVVDNVTAYNTSAHNISGVSAIEGSTAAGLEPTIYGFKSINGTTLSSTNISGPTLTKNTDNIINATNVVESNSANWSNLSAIKYYTTSNELTSYTTTNGTVTFSSNNIGISVDDNNNLLLEVDENFGNSYYNYATKLSTNNISDPAAGNVSLGHAGVTGGGLAWAMNKDSAAIAKNKAIALKGSAYNGSITLMDGYSYDGAIAIKGNSSATDGGIAIKGSSAKNGGVAIVNSTALNHGYAYNDSSANYDGIAIRSATASNVGFAFDTSFADFEGIALTSANAERYSIAQNASTATYTAVAINRSTADNNSLAFALSNASTGSIAIKGSTANNYSIAIHGATDANNGSIALYGGNADDHSVTLYGGIASGDSVALYGATARDDSFGFHGGSAYNDSIEFIGGTASNGSFAFDGGTSNNHGLAAFYGANASDYSVALGVNTKSTDYSIALGYGTTAEHSACAIGNYNTLTPKTTGKTILFAVGNGTSDTDRKNAFEVYTDGSIYAPNLNIDTAKWEYGTDDEYRPISFANSTYKSSYDASQTFYGSMVYDRDVTNGLRYNPVKQQLRVSAISASKLNLGDNCDIVFGNNTKSSLKQQIGITTGRSSKEIIWTFNNNSRDSSAYLGFTYFNQPSIDTVTATNRITDGIGGWFYFGGQDIDTNGTPTVDCYSKTAEGYGVIAKAYSASEYYLGNSKISDLINAAGSKAYVNGTTLML